MDALLINADEDTPKIVLDKGNQLFEISGNSLPEDIIKFYTPVFKWVEDYQKQPNPHTRLVIKLNYFNSSSAKVILDILTMFADIIHKGGHVEVDWHYLDMDEDNLQMGKEFEGLSKIPFRYIPYQDDGVSYRFKIE